MTSYIPQTRFVGEQDWKANTGFRFATPEEAQASLAEIIATRVDLAETRIVESLYKPSFKWVIVIDPIDGTSIGAAIPRGNTDRDQPKKYRR